MRRQVDADLMGPSRVELQSQQRHGVGLFDSRDDLISRARGAAVGAHRHHGRRSRRTSDRGVDDAALFGDVALDHAVVGALHETFGQLRAEVRESLGRLGDDQDTRGPFVQPVHDARAQGITETLVAEQLASGDRAPADRPPTCRRGVRRPGARPARALC